MKTLNKAELLLLDKYKQELVLRRCALDPEYFFENFVQVVDKNSPTGRSLFKLRDYQREDLETFKTNLQVVILKSRQLGLSTLALAYCLHRLMFSPGGFSIGMTSFRDDAVVNNLRMIKEMFEYLPDWILSRFILDKSNNRMFSIINKGTGYPSMLNGQIANPKALASGTYDLLLLDEFGLSNYQNEVLNTVLPTVNIAKSRRKDVTVMIVSTARGSSNAFAKTFWASWNKVNAAYAAIFHPWTCDPYMTQDIYDQKFADAVDRGETYKFHAEYPATPEEAFRESGSPLFRQLPDYETLAQTDWARGNVYGSNGQYEFRVEEDGPFRMRNKRIDESLSYVIGADTSNGEAADFQAAQVGAINPVTGEPEIVAWYHANDVKPIDFAEDLNKIGRLFAGRAPEGAATLAIENQGGYGQAVIQQLFYHLDYPSPYYHVPIGQNTSISKQRPFAFPMHMQIREAVLARLKDKLKPVATGDSIGPTLKGLYPELREELGRFVRHVVERPTGNTVRYAAEIGSHDDLVMSLAIMLWALTEQEELNIYDGDAHQSVMVEELVARSNARYIKERHQSQRNIKENFYIF